MEKIKEPIIDIAVVLLVPVFVVVGYFYVWKSPNPNESMAPADNVEARSQKVREALQIMQRLKLDGEIFSDPVFLFLQDQTVPIAPENYGRENPFYPAQEVEKLEAKAKAAKGR